MSRNNIDVGYVSLHPAGIPHGPHPGAAERSIGKKGTEELAVMVDTFKPLKVTKEAEKLADEDYYKSWLRSEEHTSELQSRGHLVCRLLLEKKKQTKTT